MSINNSGEECDNEQKYVLNKTFEPEALLHSAYILKANGKLKKAIELKEETK